MTGRLTSRLVALVGVLVILLVSAARADEVAPPAGAASAGPGGWGPRLMHLPEQQRRAEQGILRPIPITVALPDEIAGNAARVLVSYRLWGEPEWSTILLRRVGARFEGAVPCLEVSTVTGDFRYTIRVHDAAGRLIAQGGSRASPYIVAIKHDTSLSAGQRERARCPDPTSCPRGLPGCPSEAVEVVCESDRDCDEGTECGARGVCVKATKKNRIVLAVSQDLGLVSRTGACGVASQESLGYGCYRADGVRYAGRPVTTNEGLAPARGSTRVIVGFERTVSFNTSLGLRVGWAFLGEGPTLPGGMAFLPLSASVRVTHWFGDDPFNLRSLRPFMLVGGGYSMFDLEAKGRVRENPTLPSSQSGNDLEQSLTIWQRAGDGFVSVGGGVALPLGSVGAALLDAASFEVTVSQAFPYGATVVTPSLALQVLP